METTKYNALEELHNELNRGTPGDEVSLNIGGKEVLKIKFQTGGTAKLSVKLAACTALRRSSNEENSIKV